MDSEINEAEIEFLRFDVELARKIGVHEAIVFERIRHWCRGPKSHDIEGQSWIYNSFEDWERQLPFKARTIKTLIARLKELKLINVNEFNKNRYRRPNWYSVNLEVYQAIVGGIVSANLAPSESANLAPSFTKKTCKEDTDNSALEKESREGDQSNGQAATDQTIHDSRSCQSQKAKEGERKTEGFSFSGKDSSWDSAMRTIHSLRSRDVAEGLGLYVDRTSAVLCPWHDDHTPSLIVGYSNRVACRSADCEASEDVIGLVRQVLSLDFFKARDWLCEHYHIEKPQWVSNRKVLPDEEGLKVLADHGLTWEEVSARRDVYPSTMFKGYSATGSSSWAFKLDGTNRQGKPAVTVRVVNAKPGKKGEKPRKYRNNCTNRFFKTGHPGDKTVIMTAGPFDALTINIKTGLAAWSSICGEKSIPEDYLLHMKHLNEVLICYDNDSAGQAGAARLAMDLRAPGLQHLKIHYIHLPIEFKDVGEYFSAGHTGEAFKALVADAKTHPQSAEGKTWEKKTYNPFEQFFNSQTA